MLANQQRPRASEQPGVLPGIRPRIEKLIDAPPYGPRDDAEILDLLNRLTAHHLQGCPEYARIWPDAAPAASLEQAPFLHVGLFKHLTLKTEAAGVEHQRTLLSSSTTGAGSSRISLDAQSSILQGRSTTAILQDYVGRDARPLIVIDSARSLRRRGEISARIAAAMSLRPLSSQLHFALEEADDPASMRWDAIAEAIEGHEALLVYGFTWTLWLAWGALGESHPLREKLAGKRIHFVHSGGWKRLEGMQVDVPSFEKGLLAGLHADSKVVDYYGLVEQVGIIYPRCEYGFRHVPIWADVLVRDPYRLDSLVGEAGQLQLVNLLSFGAPYQNVLTEDLGRIVPGECACRRSGSRFELLGRVPKAELRGCGNV